jgi:RNA polymerase sigma factor (sigma-70 family)
MATGPSRTSSHRDRRSERAPDLRPSLPTAVELADAEPVIRRVLAARVRDKTAVDDLVQDALTRLLAAEGRLAPEMVVPYAVVTARNAAADHGRRAERRAALRPRLADMSVPEQPDEAVIRTEERAAMTVALSRLPEPERSVLMAHDLDGTPIAELAVPDVTEATMRVRLARSRAKLRVEYVLALRKVTLPSARCRPTLLALTGSDRGRSSSSGPARHLVECETCASLSEPLVRRHRGMAALFPFVVAWRFITRAANAHPAATVATTAASVAVAAGATIAAVGGPSPPVALHHPAATRPTAAPGGPPTPLGSAAPPMTVQGLTVDGRPVLASDGSLAADVGQQAVGTDAVVEAVATHDGFWIGANTVGRVWVQMTGPLRSLQVIAGERVSFTASVVSQPGGFAVDAGVTPSEGAAQLTAQGAHLSVPTTALTLIP